MATAFDLLVLGIHSGPSQGSSSNWGSVVDLVFNFAIDNDRILGSASNWGNQDYSGVLEGVTVLADYDPVKGYKKPTNIYYKLKGFYPTSGHYETWVVTEDITTSPLTYSNPTQFTGTLDSINLLPPSGHALVDIVIIKRWFE